MTLTVAAAGRRYVGLTALRWLPVGLSVPVSVLLAQSRGLSVAQVGLVFAVYGMVCLVLELPTGGLADAIGRRPVLVLSGSLHLLGLLGLAVAPNLPAFIAAISLIGAGRALDSGPLESWYVDAVHQVTPGADVTPGLSRAAVADGIALSLGAVARRRDPVAGRRQRGRAGAADPRRRRLRAGAHRRGREVRDPARPAEQRRHPGTAARQHPRGPRHRARHRAARCPRTALSGC